jgi:transglutaminase-like putative cysteine protease
MTTSPLRQTRGWVVTAAGLSQVAATKAGMLPWWALPVTILLTVAVARQTGPISEQRAKTTRGVAVTAVAGFTVFIAAKAIAAGGDGADPLGTMRLLTEALVVLSLAMAPTWRTTHDYRLWLSVTTGVLVAATVGSHNIATDVLLVGAWIVTLLAMASVQGAALVAAVTPQAGATPAVPPHPGPLGVATPVVASLTAGVLVFLALPAGLGGGNLASHLVHHPGNNPNGQQSSRGVVGVDTVGFGVLNLLVRGALPTTPLLRVPADSPQLWRGSIYSTYSGDSWTADLNQRLSFVRGSDPKVPPSAEDPRPVGTVNSYQVDFVPGLNSSLVWAPGVPLRLHGDGGEIAGVARGPANLRIIGAQNLTGYTVTTAVPTTSPSRLQAAVGPDGVGPEWTQLPTELPASVSQLAHRITAGMTNRYEMVNALEAYLRANETYTLNSPVPGSGQDAVADFLFRDHTGFCEQFASALAVMLRTLQVPARVVSGLAYGTPQGNTRLITDADAHAWVEVHYPGIGWSPTDPTAGVSLAPTQATSPSPISAALHRISRDLPGGRIGLLGLLLVAIVAAIGLGRVMRFGAIGSLRRRKRQAAVGPVLTAFLRFAHSRRAAMARAPAETAREYIGRLDGPPDDLQAAVTTLEQECYGETPPDDAAVAAAVGAFDVERAETARRL